MMIEGPCQASASRMALRVCAWSAPIPGWESEINFRKEQFKLKFLSRKKALDSITNHENQHKKEISKKVALEDKDDIKFVEEK